MYKFFIRPILFLLNPEYVHHLVMAILKIGFRIPFSAYLAKKTYTTNHTSLKRSLWGLEFQNPVGLAAGFDKNAECFNELSNLGFSFIEIGTVTPKGQPGNSKPRLFRLKKDKGLINRMGFNNLGVEEAVNKLRKKNTKIII